MNLLVCILVGACGVLLGVLLVVAIIVLLAARFSGDGAPGER